MSIFSLGRKPRRFSHVPIFYDERQDRLKEIERRARREAECQTEEFHPEAMRGAFETSMPHLQRHKQRKAYSWTSNVGMLALIIVVLLLMWYYLVK